MGIMDSFLSAMKLGENDEDYEDEYLDEPDEGTEPVKPRVVKNDSDDDAPAAKRPSVVKPSIARNKKTMGDGMEVCVIKPTSVEEAREITDTLLANRTVVLNLEGLDVDIAQRIVDYTSGSCYAIRGNLQKISHYIFIITPASVDISGDFQEIISGSFDVPSI